MHIIIRANPYGQTNIFIAILIQLTGLHGIGINNPFVLKKNRGRFPIEKIKVKSPFNFEK